MIFTQRGKKPAILRAQGAAWSVALKVAKSKPEKDAALGRYRHKEIKAALRAAFHDKCAYCESHIAHVAYGHIEHYRPKERYPSKAFDWSNLLLACGICNGAEGKSNRFPDAANNGPYINPCKDDPASHLSFRWDPGTRVAVVAATTARGQTTIDDLRLNRTELVRHRSQSVARIAVLAAIGGADPLGRGLLAEIRQRSIAGEEEYAAFCRPLLGI